MISFMVATLMVFIGSSYQKIDANTPTTQTSSEYNPFGRFTCPICKQNRWVTISSVNLPDGKKEVIMCQNCGYITTVIIPY